MSIAHRAFKGASWLALFKFTGQLFSWVITILVARILSPGDYGLYAMAFIVTGYAEKFSQLGLGAAIIQKQSLNHSELSSVYWFSFIVGLVFAVACFPISYLTSYLFHDSRVIPLTQAAAVIFILSSLTVVPSNMLRKELEFKRVGQIEFTGVFVAGLSMLLIAHLGGGTWALVGSKIVLMSVTLLLLMLRVKWRPKFHFKFYETRSYLKFGALIAGGGSLFYIFENSDKYFAGRELGSVLLGYYTLALTLARLPTDKIIVLINQVSFPTFSKLLDDTQSFNNFYLNIIKVTATIIFPIYVGGFLVGGDIIKVLLGDKWIPIIHVFEWLCLSQIITALNAYNNFVHDARGKPNLSFQFNLILAITMPISFYIAAKYGLNALIIPWFTVYLFVSIYWISYTLKALKIDAYAYLIRLKIPVLSTIAMSAAIYLFSHFVKLLPFANNNLIFILICKIMIGIIVYGICIWMFDRSIFYNIMKLKTNRA